MAAERSEVTGVTVRNSGFRNDRNDKWGTAMQKLILAGLFVFISATAQAGLSTAPHGQASSQDARAEVRPEPKKRPLTFEKQIERSLQRAFRF